MRNEPPKEAAAGEAPVEESSIVYVPSYLNWLQTALLVADLPNAVILRYEDAFNQEDYRPLYERLRQEAVTGVQWEDFQAAALNRLVFESVSGERKRGDIDATSAFARGEVGSWRSEWATEMSLLDHPVVTAYCKRFGDPLPND